MFTPQQLEQISFGKQTFGGYDMNDVDEFLEPLIEDYVTLYKENALLKSKMRVLVGKLEEYRKNEASMKDAIVNARLNGVKNCWFTQGDAGRYMEQMVADGHRCDVVFMDPPRAGSDQRFLSSLLQCAPKKIVYISCNPETQARDLRHLINGGYKVRKIQPVDMFPHTSHVECVVLLTKVHK